MWGPFQATGSSRPPGLDYAGLHRLFLSAVPRMFLFLADVDPPGPGACDHHHDLQDCWGSTVPCSSCPLPTRSLASQGCQAGQGPIIPVHDLRYAWTLEATLRKTPRTIPRPRPASPDQPGADLHLQVSPEDPGFPFRQCLWRSSLTVLGKQSSTSPNVMRPIPDSFWQVRSRHYACANSLRHHSPPLSHFLRQFLKKTREPGLGQDARCHPNTSRLSQQFCSG